MITKNTNKTKVIATVGPASNSYQQLLNLVIAGVNTFRLNFSHGTHEDHLAAINNITYLNQKYSLHIGILADLQGPKIRVGKIKNNKVLLKTGEEIVFVTEECLGNDKKVFINYKGFPQDVKAGETILVDDGKLILNVIKTNKKDLVKLKVEFGGYLSSNKGVNLPNTKISLPCLTKKDKVDLDFILSQESINWIALSFVRSPKDIKLLRKHIEEKNHLAKIVAKIEKPEALKKLHKIIRATDAVMVARGDLGIEVEMEKLPLIQKQIVAQSIKEARPVIVATQMMESMITNPSPTRAEITDVANAVLDGADAVMLSGETAAGAHPVKVVEAMERIVREAEKHLNISHKRPAEADKTGTFLSDSICFYAARIAELVNAKAIIGMTASGYTAFKVSSYRPSKDIFIFSDQMSILATLNLVWGVRCFYYDRFTSTDETIEDVTEILKNAGEIKNGDITINTGTMPLRFRNRTNMLKITVVK